MVETNNVYDFNFDLLPESEYKKAKYAIGHADLNTLFLLTITYKLTKFDYCCPCIGIYNHFIPFYNHTLKTINGTAD